jgi:hypothetical protein
VAAEIDAEADVLPPDFADRYFGDQRDTPMGKRTIMIRDAFQKVQRRQQGKYRRVIGLMVVVALCASAYALYERRQRQMLENEAEDAFYFMKSMDVRIADLERSMDPANQDQARALAGTLEERRLGEANYDERLKRLYDRHLDPRERLILQVTRIFGECELRVAPEYLSEVKHYIQLWRSTGRFEAAVKRAQANGYSERIAFELMSRHLPPQFFYLAMQESSFLTDSSGKPTKYGIAKGMWQFIPQTGKQYGLIIGPLEKQSRPADPADDRLNWEKATVAAAKYIKDLYATDAQASGLLVMASYNWGETRVVDLVRKLPPNPRDRNWWTLVETYRQRLPGETYDYVFNIVAAAVIGENPRLFGFNFDNPLAFPPRAGTASN